MKEIKLTLSLKVKERRRRFFFKKMKKKRRATCISYTYTQVSWIFSPVNHHHHYNKKSNRDLMHS